MRNLVLLSAGSNARGQLATGNCDDAHNLSETVFADCLPGRLPPNIQSIDHIACGANHSFALLRTEAGGTELWACGDGSRGQLGPSYFAETKDAPEHTKAAFRRLDLGLLMPGNTTGSLDYNVSMVAAGWETSYIVLTHSETSDILLSMGANDFGNLGVGSVSNPGSVTGVYSVPLDEHLPPEHMRSDTRLRVVSLATGPHHTIALVRLTQTDGITTTVVLGWGTSRHGQLGPVLHVSSGKPLPTVSRPRLVPVTSPEHIHAIALGNHHTVCLHNSGHVLALGSDRKSQLSGVDTLRDVEQVGCTWNGTYALLRSDEVVAAGSNTHSQLGRGPGTHERQCGLASVRFPDTFESRRVVRLVCGSEHVLCIVEVQRDPDGRAQREVWGWGWNEHGNLGVGGTEDASTPTRIWPPAHTVTEGGEYGNVLDVWAGCGTSWMLVER